MHIEMEMFLQFLGHLKLVHIEIKAVCRPKESIFKVDRCEEE